MNSETADTLRAANALIDAGRPAWGGAGGGRRRMKNWSDKVKQLEKVVSTLRDELRRAESALGEAKIAECGVSIGDIVEEQGGRGQLIKVTEVEPDHFGKPWVSGNPQKKDGTFGTAIRRLYDDWEVVR